MVENDEKKFIAMGFDPLFKKMYGDVNYTNKAAALVSIVLSIPYEDIKDRIDVVNNEKLRKNKSDKKQERDVLLKIQLHSEYHFINLEANLFGYNQELIDRNTSYISDIYSSQLDESDDYSFLRPVIQINFNKPAKKVRTSDLYKPISTYLLRNEDGQILTDMIKIINVDIVKCYFLWYNGGIEKFTSCEQNIIRLGALHFIEKEEDFRKCLGEIKMDKDVKSKIQRDMDEYQRDKNLVRVYDAQKRRDAEWKALFRELDRDKEQIDKEKEKLCKEKEKLDKDKEQLDKDKEQLDKDKEQLDKDKEQLNKDKKQFEKDKKNIDNQKDSILQEKISIAKILKDTGISAQEISNRLNISIDEINKYV